MKNVMICVDKKLILFLFILCTLFACDDLVDIDSPVSQIVDEKVFSDDVVATSAISGIYSYMLSSGGFASGGLGSVTLFSGLSSDELITLSGSGELIQAQENAVVSTSNYNQASLWANMYNQIYNANALLEGLDRSGKITVPTKMQLTGEAKFVRAFCYFYLVNMYGEVPLLLSTDYKVNAVASRTSVDDVYKQIINDLTDAEQLLPEDFSSFLGERVRPIKYTASALLSRVYLYRKDWVNAETKASLVINKSDLFSLPDKLSDVFLMNSSEAIWQLKPVVPGFNTNEGNYFIPADDFIQAALREDLLTSAAPNDKRQFEWIDSTDIGGTLYYYPYKYKVRSGNTISEYSMVFRLAEQYLIRAEARAKNNDLTGAIDDLDRIRSRAGISLIADEDPGADQDKLLVYVENERRIELFSEWGHRWFDLKRTNRAGDVLSPVKTDWQSTDTLYPIPKAERDANIHLSQNTGY